MGVDRSDRKLINDALAALLIEDRLLSVPVSSLAQLEGLTSVPNPDFRPGSTKVGKTLHFVMAK